MVPEQLRRLIQQGESMDVELKGEAQRTYHLSAATYRRLGEPSAYVHQRGFEPLQQEQMVLQYVQKYGRITRAEAAELCRLSPSQAYRLLQRLVKSGKLVQHGRKKGSWYERQA